MNALVPMLTQPASKSHSILRPPQRPRWMPRHTAPQPGLSPCPPVTLAIPMIAHPTLGGVKSSWLGLLLERKARLVHPSRHTLRLGFQKSPLPIQVGLHELLVVVRE